MIYKIVFAIVVGVLALIWSSIGCYALKKKSDPLMCFAIINGFVEAIIILIILADIAG